MPMLEAFSATSELEQRTNNDEPEKITSACSTTVFEYIFQRNGHWTNGYQPNHNMSNSAEHHNPRNSNGNVHNPNPNGISPNGDINSAGSGAGSRGSGSQSALLSVKRERHKWPKGKDFLFSTWAFVIGKRQNISFLIIL